MQKNASMYIEFASGHPNMSWVATGLDNRKKEVYEAASYAAAEPYMYNAKRNKFGRKT